jgi:lipopolysaccharide transport system ATP-binding protein
MSGDVVIHAEGLGKKYVIGHEIVRERYTALRDVIARRAKALVRTTSDMLRGRAIIGGDTTDEIWALKDINFEIKRGEVVGIIGRNGAGKSTLLKILSRITEPTEGQVVLHGRVASLLEVGTGFHGELTGRENIFLNGAILGMTQAEIRGKFDEIVAFADVERFLDTPVKRYSSGMYVRLAFSVAAHLEPEILLVDEVLAVGDVEFQTKCLGKMGEVASAGRTVLFVSHNMAAIQRLCSRAILLSDGTISASSDQVHSCIQEYLALTRELLGSEWTNDGSSYNNEYFVPKTMTVLSNPNASLQATASERKFIVLIGGVVHRSEPSLSIALSMYSPDGQRLFWSSVYDAAGGLVKRLPLGDVRLSVELPSNLLNEGEYEIEISVMLHNRQFVIPPGTGPRIKLRNTLRYASPFWDRHREGPIAPLLSWRVESRAVEISLEQAKDERASS